MNGVKRFITNGDSYSFGAGTFGGRYEGRVGCRYLFDKNNGGITVRRIENKMGIKGAPTCELVLKCQGRVVGSRRLGLIKYVMSLMNGARLGIMAQSVGYFETAISKPIIMPLNVVSSEKQLLSFLRIRNDCQYTSKTDASRSFVIRNVSFCGYV